MYSNKPFKLFVSFLILFIAGHTVFCQSDSTKNLFQLSLEELMDQSVVVATKSPVKIKRAPAVVTVITKEEIAASPARNIEQLLELIPGFEFTQRVNGGDGVGFRGVKDNRLTAKYLVLIDGQPFNQVYRGVSFAIPYYVIDINSIERIEIIRGPGSALYGKNAFLSVINIITKTASEVETIHGNIYGGSFNTYKAYLSFAKKISSNKHFLISASHLNTDNTDTKTYDEYGNLKRWNEKTKNTYINLNGQLGDFTFHSYGLLVHGGTSLNDSYSENHAIYYSLKYENKLTEKLNVKATFFGHNLKISEFFEEVKEDDETIVVPATDTTPAIALRDIYPNGIYYNPYYSEYNYGMDLITEILFSENNQLLAGMQFISYGVYDVELRSNINLRTGEYYPEYTRDNLPLDTLGWFEKGKHAYNNFAFYVQDIWYPFKKIGITAGARFDIDSEFGLKVNPRLGITWNISNAYNLKLLYGQAYRAPTPSEQYQTLGFAFGNKDIKPENIKTIELAFEQNLKTINNKVNIYYNIIDDLIYAETITSVDPTNRYYNLGENTSYGIEIESRQKFSSWIYSFINYTYNVSENTKTIDGQKEVSDHADVAPHKINCGLNLQLPLDLKLAIIGKYRSKMGKFTRFNEDTQTLETISKDPVGNYFILDAKLMYEPEKLPFTIYISGYNLLNTTYYSQDNELDHYPPMPGIHFLSGVSFRF